MASEIDFSSPAFLADPYPAYRRARELGSPYWCTHASGIGGTWVLAGYDDVAAVLKEARISKDVTRLVPAERVPPLSRAMLGKDPPDHTRLRGLVSQAFTPARISGLEAQIKQVAERLIASVQSNGCMDFIADFALPLPVIIISELLGIPYEDRDRFQTWSRQVLKPGDMVHATEDDIRQQAQSMAALASYFTELIRTRREQPQRDVISDLIAVQDTGDRLTEAELLGTCMLLLVAGYETTVNLLGNGLFTLLSRPDQRLLLERHLDLMPTAVEEMLRYESPAQRGTFRFTREAVTFRGVTIGPGQQISALLGAANRDPEQFPDADRFDIKRSPNRHLAFGLGVHFCLGAALARTEARIGFTCLLERLPNIQLVTDTAHWNSGALTRGLSTLPVTF